MNYPDDRTNGNNEKTDGKRFRNISRILINAAIAAGVLAALSLIILGVSKSGYLNMRGYEVRGNSFLTGEEIFELSGLEMETNLYSVNLSSVEKCLEHDPRVKNAVVRRRFPDTVIIEIEEVRPVAVADIGGSLYKIGEKGKIIAPLNGQYEDLPFLYGFEVETGDDDTPVGNNISGNGIELGLAVASELADCPGIGVEISAIRVDKRVIYLGNDGIEVRYDEGFDKKQVSRLNRIWGILPRTGAPYEIDARYGNDIIVRGI